MRYELSIYPGPIAARKQNSVEIMVKVDSTSDLLVWYEADVKLPPGLSLSSSGPVNSGRVRLGICEPRGYLQKGIKVYADHNTAPHLYKCDVALFAYDPDARMKNRTDAYVQLRCENR